jgi:hypothetical protein
VILYDNTGPFLVRVGGAAPADTAAINTIFGSTVGTDASILDNTLAMYIANTTLLPTTDGVFNAYALGATLQVAASLLGLNPARDAHFLLYTGDSTMLATSDERARNVTATQLNALPRLTRYVQQYVAPSHLHQHPDQVPQSCHIFFSVVRFLFCLFAYIYCQCGAVAAPVFCTRTRNHPWSSVLHHALPAIC